MLMCCAHVVAANLAVTGPAARCSAYRLSPALSRSRVSNNPIPVLGEELRPLLTARAQLRRTMVPVPC